MSFLFRAQRKREMKTFKKCHRYIFENLRFIDMAAPKIRPRYSRNDFAGRSPEAILDQHLQGRSVHSKANTRVQLQNPNHTHWTAGGCPARWRRHHSMRTSELTPPRPPPPLQKKNPHGRNDWHPSLSQSLSFPQSRMRIREVSTGGFAEPKHEAISLLIPSVATKVGSFLPAASTQPLLLVDCPCQRASLHTAPKVTSFLTEMHLNSKIGYTELTWTSSSMHRDSLPTPPSQNATDMKESVID